MLPTGAADYLRRYRHLYRGTKHRFCSVSAGFSMQTTAAETPNINSKSLTIASLMLRKRRTSGIGAHIGRQYTRGTRPASI